VKRAEATAYVLESAAELVRWGNGVPLRDGSHTPEGMEARAREHLQRPLDSMTATFAASYLLKLAIERLTTEEG
jgi:hypothetical protein